MPPADHERPDDEIDTLVAFLEKEFARPTRASSPIRAA